MERFQLTDAQAEAILELKLRHLAQAGGDGDPRRAGQAAERARRAGEDPQLEDAAAQARCATS